MLLTRRGVLGLLATAPVAAFALGCGEKAPPIPPALPGPGRSARRLPGRTRNLAWTVDDGSDPAVLAAYLDLCRATRFPVTFAVTAKFSQVWQSEARAIRELVGSGVIQIINHGLSHRPLNKLSDAEVSEEIQRNEDWIQETFKITSRPYLRPPGGAFDARVASLSGALGFTTLLLWNCSLQDAEPVPTEVVGGRIDRALFPGALVLGHANASGIVPHLPHLPDLVMSRRLTPVTIDQAFGTSRQTG